MEYTYDGRVVRVIDGDTVELELFKTFSFDVDFGFYVKQGVQHRLSTQVKFRLMGINTPEITGVSAEEKARGLVAKDTLSSLLASGPLKVTTYRPDKYGRWLCTIIVERVGLPPINVNEELVNRGLAVPYMV